MMGCTSSGHRDFNDYLNTAPYFNVQEHIMIMNAMHMETSSRAARDGTRGERRCGGVTCLKRTVFNLQAQVPAELRAAS